MLAVLEELKQKVASLIALIELFDLENQILTQTFPNASSVFPLSESFKAIVTSKRVFNFNTVIISLYGALESYIDSILKEYIVLLTSYHELYNELPDLVRSTHYNNTIDLLKKITSPKYQGHLTVDNVIQKLHSCLSNSPTYNINAEAFALHGANYRQEIISSVFRGVGFESFADRLSKIQPFNDRIKQVEGIPLDQDVDLTLNECYRVLDSLAEARNAVAHGGTYGILSNPTLIQYCEFIRDMSISIYNILNDNVNVMHLHKRCINLGEPVAVYSKASAIVVMSNFTPVAVGDTLKGLLKGEITLAKIISIQIEGTPVTSFDGSDNIELGFKLDQMLTKNHTVFVDNL